MNIARSDLIAALLIFTMMAGALGYVAYGVHLSIVGTEQPLIMIRKDSLERIIVQPCQLGTISYMGNYIICKRRADYEPRERKEWRSPYPQSSPHAFRGGYTRPWRKVEPDA